MPKTINQLLCKLLESKIVVFNDAEFGNPSKIRMVEIMLPKMDAPAALVKTAKFTAETSFQAE